MVLSGTDRDQSSPILGSLDFRLTDEQMAAIACLDDFQTGFPNSFLHSAHVRNLIFGDTFALIDNHRA